MNRNVPAPFATIVLIFATGMMAWLITRLVLAIRQIEKNRKKDIPNERNKE